MSILRAENAAAAIFKKTIASLNELDKIHAPYESFKPFLTTPLEEITGMAILSALDALRNKKENIKYAAISNKVYTKDYISGTIEAATQNLKQLGTIFAESAIANTPKESTSYQYNDIAMQQLNTQKYKILKDLKDVKKMLQVCLHTDSPEIALASTAIDQYNKKLLEGFTTEALDTSLLESAVRYIRFGIIFKYYPTEKTFYDNLYCLVSKLAGANTVPLQPHNQIWDEIKDISDNATCVKILLKQEASKDILEAIKGYINSAYLSNFNQTNSYLKDIGTTLEMLHAIITLLNTEAKDPKMYSEISKYILGIAQDKLIAHPDYKTLEAKTPQCKLLLILSKYITDSIGSSKESEECINDIFYFGLRNGLTAHSEVVAIYVNNLKLSSNALINLFFVQKAIDFMNIAESQLFVNAILDTPYVTGNIPEGEYLLRGLLSSKPEMIEFIILGSTMNKPGSLVSRGSDGAPGQVLPKELLTKALLENKDRITYEISKQALTMAYKYKLQSIGFDPDTLFAIWLEKLHVSGQDQFAEIANFITGSIQLDRQSMESNHKIITHFLTRAKEDILHLNQNNPINSIVSIAKIINTKGPIYIKNILNVFHEELKDFNNFLEVAQVITSDFLAHYTMEMLLEHKDLITSTRELKAAYHAIENCPVKEKLKFLEKVVLHFGDKFPSAIEAQDYINLFLNPSASLDDNIKVLTLLKTLCMHHTPPLELPENTYYKVGSTTDIYGTPIESYTTVNYEGLPDVWAKIGGASTDAPAEFA